MTHVATFKEASTYPNQRVVFDNEAFTIEGSGEVDVRHLTDFDSKGELDWISTEMRDWTYQRIDAATASVAPSAAAATQPAEKPFYKQMWFIALVVVGALLLMCSMCSVVGLLGGDDSSTTDTVVEVDPPAEEVEEPEEPVEEPEEPAEEPEEPESEVAEEEPEETGYGMGDTVTAGKFEYTVNSVSSTKELGEAPFNETTDGEFLVISVSIKNNDSEGRVMDTMMFTLLDSTGNEYDADGSAFMYLDDTDSLFLENVNPGLSRTGSVVFEVPEGLTGLSLEVDSGVLFAAGETAVIRLDR